MSSVNKDQIMQHAHSMMVEYCLLNDSRFDIINALTRDIYPTENVSSKSEFHLNIKKCNTTYHHKMSQNIHIVHFSQLKWMSTLNTRPNTMLPTAHHLILFFNYINIDNIDINTTQNIREEFIIQCLLSMDSMDINKWNKYLERYCTPYDFCPNYKELNALGGKSKQCKLYRDFLYKHTWKLFVNKLNEWCNNVINALQLKGNKTLLYRINQCINNNNNNNNNNNKIEIESNSNEIETENKENNNMSEDENENDSDNDSDNNELEVMTLTSTIESQKELPNQMEQIEDPQEDIDMYENENENEEIEDSNTIIGNTINANIGNSNLNACNLPESMPSLEMDSQNMISSLQTTMEDDYDENNNNNNENENENDDEFLSDLAHINNDTDQTGLFNINNNNNNGSMGASQTNNNENINILSDESNGSNESEILLESQANNNNNPMDICNDFVISSEPIEINQNKGFSFGYNNNNISQTDLIPESNDDISDTQSPPNNMLSPINTQMNQINTQNDDYLSQNKPPQNINNDMLSQNSINENDMLTQNVNRRGRKRTYNEMERNSNTTNDTQSSQSLSQSQSQHIIPPTKKRVRMDCKKEIKSQIVKSEWPKWMKKNIEVTIELEDELLCAKIRKVAKLFVLVKIIDDDAPNKYKNKQFKMYLKDKDKIEPVYDVNSINSDSDNNDNNNNMEVENAGNDEHKEEKQHGINNRRNMQNNNANNYQRNSNQRNDRNSYGNNRNNTMNFNVMNNRNNSINEFDKDAIWHFEMSNNDDILTPISQENNNTNNTNNNNNNKNINNNINNNNNKKKHVTFGLTLSQETKQKEKEKHEQRRNNNKRLTNRPLRTGGRHSINNQFDNNNNTNNNTNDNGIEYEWSSSEDDNTESDSEPIGNSSIFNKPLKPYTGNTHLMPKRITNKKLVNNPAKFCDLMGKHKNKNKNKKFVIKTNKSKTGRKRNTKVPWTNEEIKAIIEGYEKYKQYENASIGKPGIWSYIMKDPKLGKILMKNNRDRQNLYDKWRHLLKQKDERIAHLIKNKNKNNKNKMAKLPTKPIP